MEHNNWFEWVWWIMDALCIRKGYIYNNIELTFLRCHTLIFFGDFPNDLLIWIPELNLSSITENGNFWSGGERRGSLQPSGAKARKPWSKTEFRNEFSRSQKTKLIEFFWPRPLPVMMSSPLIGLQRPLPPSGDAISEKKNRTIKILFDEPSTFWGDGGEIWYASYPINISLYFLLFTHIDNLNLVCPCDT